MFISPEAVQTLFGGFYGGVITQAQLIKSVAVGDCFNQKPFWLSQAWSMRPHGLQHARLLCPSPTPRACSNTRLMSIKSVMPSNPLILCCPRLLLPSIKVFSKESVLCIRWPKYWSFSFSISHSNAYSVLISFRMDWLDLLAVQGTLKSLLQHHSSKASNLWHSAFFIVYSHIHT